MLQKNDYVKMNITEYERLIGEVMKESRADVDRKPRIVGNRGPEHARVVLRIMFENGSGLARVNCARMSKDVFDFDAVVAFLSNDKNSLSVIVSDEAVLSSAQSIIPELIKSLGTKPNFGVHLRAATDENVRHFTTIDGRDLRVETDTEDRVANVHFMDVKNSAKAESLFDAMVERASKLI